MTADGGRTDRRHQYRESLPQECRTLSCFLLLVEGQLLTARIDDGKSLFDDVCRPSGIAGGS